MSGLVTTQLDGILPLIARGKVRDIYEVDNETLLFVATDRISAYDVIMENGIPDKGKILTQVSIFWFEMLSAYIKTHIVAAQDDQIFERLPKEIAENDKYTSQLSGRSLLVKKYKLVPLEAIVRGYITGSAWREYKKTQTIHGVQIDNASLQESEKLPQPIFTPSTKAEQGEHDENISIAQASKIVGPEICDKVSEKCVELYTKASEYARSRGIIIADTKFEFGVTDDNELVLVDEVLTPDSSRFWRLSDYAVGRPQDSYDKEYLRSWLTKNGLAGKQGVAMPKDIAIETKQKYMDAYESLTGKKW